MRWVPRRSIEKQLTCLACGDGQALGAGAVGRADLLAAVAARVPAGRRARVGVGGRWVPAR